MRPSTIKVIADPISGIVDIGPVLPLVETFQFQALADKRQLGMTYLSFRSATHTRFAHSIGAYKATGELGDRWFLTGSITKEERDALAAYALLHDIGHPAMSHVTEDFCEMNNSEMSRHVIQFDLKEVIESCGINFDLVLGMANHSNPLYQAVSDKNVGMEKLDYLERDGFYTGYGRPPGVDYLRKYVSWVDNTVAVDEKVVEHAIDAQLFYMKMYRGVYLRKSLVIAQRMFHKAVHRLIVTGELAANLLPHMTDTELFAKLSVSYDADVRQIYDMLRTRSLYKEAIVVRPEKFARETRVAGKPIHVIGLRQMTMDAFITGSPVLQKSNHEGLALLETAIDDEAGLPRGTSLVVPVFNPERFKAKDVTVLGSDGKLHSLRDRRPAHFAGMEETAESYVALRICTRPEFRTALSEPKTAQKILSLIFHWGS